MTHALIAIIYLAFVSLGLPDGLLGAAWPAMHADLGAAVSLAGAISVVICLGTIVSSLMTDTLVRRLGTGRLTAASVALTAVALFGFSTCTALWQLVLWAIPYGLGAGAVDAALNAFVATHYAARHMNWLHCCWGIGAAAGPMVMSWQMSGAAGWPGGYRVVGVVQVALVAAIALSLPLWHDRKGGAAEKGGAHGAPPFSAAPPLRSCHRRWRASCATARSSPRAGSGPRRSSCLGMGSLPRPPPFSPRSSMRGSPWAGSSRACSP